MRQGGASYSAASVILIIVALIGGGVMAYLNGVATGDQYKRDLTNRAATMAAALDSDKVSELTGVTADTNKPAYRELQTKLRLLKQSNSDTISIYLTGIENGQAYFKVDSEVPGTMYYTAPGEPYLQASALFKSVFDGTSPYVEGPISDAHGQWLSGLAPVVDLRTGQAVGVLGVDVNAASFNQAITISAGIPLLVMAIFLTVVIIYERGRLRQQRELRMRSELMSIASHELRTPITGMRWAAESLLHTQPDGPTKAMAQAMYDSVLNLQAGTEDILQLTRLQKNPKMQMAPTDLVPLVNEICGTQRILAGQRRVIIKMDESWPTTLLVSCDPARMKQVFHNIVSNAVKYTAQGTTVVLSYKKDAKFHKIMVSDKGIGIPKDEQSRVFEGFYRASNAKATGETGTGLGLYLSKTIVEQHHGKITYETEQNKGTTFTVSIPSDKK